MKRQCKGLLLILQHVIGIFPGVLLGHIGSQYLIYDGNPPLEDFDDFDDFDDAQDAEQPST